MMAGIFTLASFSSHKIKSVPIEIFLTFYWLSFEIMHLFWELSWPWMSLGNAFANQIKWIQWYEYLGVYGGGIWIILVNGLIFRLIKAILSHQKKMALGFTLGTFLLLFFPIYFSYSIFENPAMDNQKLEISVVQPNIDTYLEKFDGLPASVQSEKLINQLKNKQVADLVILPETVIPEEFNLNELPYPQSVQNIFDWSAEKKKTIIGGFYTKDKLNYNSALLVENGKLMSGRNKSKLLPFAETMPFEKLTIWLKQRIQKEGGIGFSYGRDSKAKVLNLNYFANAKVGVLICFESVFQDITTEIVRNGANFLVIITNDDWWRNSPGHKQHFAYSRLRAIENRRSIARSANTGISGFINEKGEILQASQYKEACILTECISLSTTKTFYSQFEAYIRWSILVVSSILLLLSILNYKK